MLVEAMAAGKTKHFGAPHLSITLHAPVMIIRHDDITPPRCAGTSFLRSELLTSRLGD